MILVQSLGCKLTRLAAWSAGVPDADRKRAGERLPLGRARAASGAGDAGRAAADRLAGDTGAEPRSVATAGQWPLRLRFSVNPDVDFRVGQLALGYDEKSSLYLLLAHSVDSESGDNPDFTCQATRPQLRTLSEAIPELLAAGRPRCPMCEAPLGSAPHHCARSNGHIRGLEK